MNNKDISLDEQTAWKIAMQLIATQKTAYLNCQFDLWMQTMYIVDDVAIQILQSWFKTQIACSQLQEVTMKLLDVHIKDASIVAKVQSIIEYVSDPPDKNLAIFTIAFITTLNEWRITVIKKVLKPFLVAECEQRSIPLVVNNHNRESFEPWWAQQAYLNTASQSRDPLSPQLYAKAIPRTVRFREEHPEIECSAILADMMSISVAQQAIHIADTSQVQTLANLYYFAADAVQSDMIRSDRINEWESKLQAPWFGFDELKARSSHNVITGTCPSLLSFYYAILRLSGFGPFDLTQLRLHNVDNLVTKVDKKYFKIGTDFVDDFQKKSFQPPTRVYKVFSDIWYWTWSGITNVPVDWQNDFLFFLQEGSPFQFTSSQHAIKNVNPLKATAALNLQKTDDDKKLHQYVKQQVLDLSSLYPYSPFTWAKYAYQSLLVAKPEAYAFWSLSSPLVDHALRASTDIHSILKTIQSFGTDSIFQESDRLMTADQVFRYKTGDVGARALLLFTFFKRAENVPCFVIYTDKYAYCIRQQERKWVVWDPLTLQTVSSPEGKLILAFDEHYSIHPFIKSTSTEKDGPSWQFILSNL